MIDFLIIGGGIAGLSAAARLAPHGSVTLIEAEDALGYHASGRSAAMFEENYGSPSTIALNRASKDYLVKAEVLSPRGFILLGTADSMDRYNHDKSVMNLAEIGTDQAKAMVPILDTAVITHTAYDDAAQDIDTDKLLQGYARTARRNGAQILTKSGATAIRKAQTGWAVTTPHTTVETRLLINAAGAWADPVAGLAGIPPIGITPHRRSMARIPAPGGHDVTGWPMFFGAGETWYAKPDAGKLLVSPADEDPVDAHDAWPDDMVLAEGIARYQDHVTEQVTRVESSWAGLRSFSPDRSLVIGFEPTEPSFFWLAAQGGYGMQSSPAASQLCADLITGATSELDDTALAALDPARFTRAG